MRDNFRLIISCDNSSHNRVLTGVIFLEEGIRLRHFSFEIIKLFSSSFRLHLMLLIEGAVYRHGDFFSFPSLPRVCA